jgi:transcriptional regulator with XRE-family HTH domain
MSILLEKRKCFYSNSVNTFPQDVCKLIYMQTIGERIRARRKEAKMTQAEVAALMGGGAKRESVSQWETDAHSPSGENLLKLAHALGVTPDWLISGRGDPSGPELEPAPMVSWFAIAVKAILHEE